MHFKVVVAHHDTIALQASEVLSRNGTGSVIASTHKWETVGIQNI